MAKMGISTLQSYKGAQIFEAVGINSEVINKCFRGTSSRLAGVDFRILSNETYNRYLLAYGPRQGGDDKLSVNPIKIFKKINQKNIGHQHPFMLGIIR